MGEYVAGKGLSEREGAGGPGVLPVACTVSENDLTQLQAQIQNARKTVAQFLVESGFEQTEISNTPPQITDVRNASGDTDVSKRPFRYQANITVLLRSAKIAKVKAAME